MGSSLQILCLAILDSIFVHIANLAAQTSWESIRRNLCKALIKEKEQQVCRILERSYGDQDVIFIQEAAAALVQQVSRHTELSIKFFLLVPANLDSKRDQNSVIFVARGRFEELSSIDVTAHVAETLEGDFVDAGDLFVVGAPAQEAAGGPGRRERPRSRTGPRSHRPHGRRRWRASAARCQRAGPMIEFPPPILEHFCALFVHIAQMGLILPRIPQVTPVLYSAITNPFEGYVRTQNTQTPPQNIPLRRLFLA